MNLQIFCFMIVWQLLKITLCSLKLTSFIILTIQHNAIQNSKTRVQYIFFTNDLCRVNLYFIQNLFPVFQARTFFMYLSSSSYSPKHILLWTSAPITGKASNCNSSSGSSLVNVKSHRLWFYKTSWIGVKIATCGVKKCHPGVNKRFKMESRRKQAPCLSFSCELSATTCSVSRGIRRRESS